MTFRPLILAALAAAVGLAGCGKLGALERPGPLIGSGASGADAGPDPAHAIRTVDPRNRDSDPATRSAPIDSAPNPAAAPQ